MVEFIDSQSICTLYINLIFGCKLSTSVHNIKPVLLIQVHNINIYLDIFIFIFIMFQLLNIFCKLFLIFTSLIGYTKCNVAPLNTVSTNPYQIQHIQNIQVENIFIFVGILFVFRVKCYPNILINKHIIIYQEESVNQSGYPLEKYKLQTLDKFTLGLERIPFSKNGDRTIGKPILLMHGLFLSSFVFTNTNKSLSKSLYIIYIYIGWFGNIFFTYDTYYIINAEKQKCIKSDYKKYIHK